MSDVSDKLSIKSHRDLIVWQKAMDLVIAVYRVSKGFPKEETYGLTGQMRRAAASIPSNIAEGQGRRLKRVSAVSSSCKRIVAGTRHTIRISSAA
jgi:four helix bundle protein